MAAKELTTVEQKGENHNYDSSKVAIRQAAKETHIANERLRSIYGERGKK